MAADSGPSVLVAMTTEADLEQLVDDFTDAADLSEPCQ